MERLHTWTPLLESTPLSHHLNQQVSLKMESSQPTGSFKIRGIGHLAQALVQSGQQHLVSSSGGNAGYAVAYAAKQLGVKATVFVPTLTSSLFINCIQAQGASVNVVGSCWDVANKAALAFAQVEQAGFLPPFDHPLIWKGHATLVDELVMQMKKPEAILVAVGGGGLACGLLHGLHKVGWGDVTLFAAEAQGAAKLSYSMKMNQWMSLESVNTVATSLATRFITQSLFEWTKKHKLIPLLVSDKQALAACRRFADEHRTLVEPACGIALAPAYFEFPQLKNIRSLLIIVCGGVGVSLKTLTMTR